MLYVKYIIFKITSLCPLTLQGSTGQTQQCSSRWGLIRKPCLSQSLEMNMMSAKVTRRRLDRNWNWVNHSLIELASMDCCHHRLHSPSSFSRTSSSSRSSPWFPSWSSTYFDQARGRGCTQGAGHGWPSQRENRKPLVFVGNPRGRLVIPAP